MIRTLGYLMKSLILLIISWASFTLQTTANSLLETSTFLGLRNNWIHDVSHVEKSKSLCIDWHMPMDAAQFKRCDISRSDLLIALQSNHTWIIKASVDGHVSISQFEIPSIYRAEFDCKDINTASASVIMRVRGIGRAKALRIIAYRDQNGPFQSLDELANVKGIGAATVEIFRIADFCVRKDDGENQPQTPPYSDDPSDSVEDCIDMNTANVNDLQRVKTIGAVKAQAVINYRNENGPYKSLNELTNVKGIGLATLEKFRKAGFCVLNQINTNGHSESSSETTNHSSSTMDNNCDDINTTIASALQRVRGIGAAKAHTIIEYRDRNGPFQSLDELIRVNGIGESTLENFRSANFCVRASNHERDDPDRQTYGALTDYSRSVTPCENINSSNSTTLQLVDGIDPASAQSIIDHRDHFGPFSSMEALLDVYGINDTMLSDLQQSGFCAETNTKSTHSEDPLFIPPDTSKVHISALPYQRSLYGGWLDFDNDCQNTRHEVLVARSLVDASLDESGCFVIGGQWYDPYLDTLITDPSNINIDHFIPLAEAHRSGGAKWNDSTRYSFGNDLSENGVLIPVYASVNLSKGSRDPAHWLPPNSDYHCQYTGRWVELKNKWRLTMDYAEQQAVKVLLENCTTTVNTP
ncbi:MAG: helix-hairpin-helix domain-containing protein [Bacteroidetes bacterium]|nr:helix-hairpin-helix domain-containing protein [Bacteroidota bacterium]